MIFIFCSLTMSHTIATENLCSFVLPFGHAILSHCIYSLQKVLETANAKSQHQEDQSYDSSNFQNATVTSIIQICSLSSINAMLESIIVVLKNEENNQKLQEEFQFSLLLNDIIKIIKIFERKMVTDNSVREQFENKIKNMTMNIELIVKLMYFAPIQLMYDSIHLIHNMLGYHRLCKTGIFAVYCVALKIQDNEPQCLNNIVPVFGNEEILKELFSAIRDVDNKFSKLKDNQVGRPHKKESQSADLLSRYESQSKAALSLQNKTFKQELDAQREFEESLAARKSCLQILVIIIEFLSNAIVKNGSVCVESPAKVTLNTKAPSKAVKPVVFTNISEAQHQELIHLLYQKFELLDLIYKQIIMKIPDQNQEPADGKNQRVQYVPNIEEIKLAARAFASMPFKIFKDKNPIVNLESKFEDVIFSIGGYFKALAKIIDQGYSSPQKTQTETSAPEDEEKNEDLRLDHKDSKKQATYFALYALLEFITSAQLQPEDDNYRPSSNGNQKDKTVESEALKLDQMTYRHVLICLIRTGLL
jgi:hypothetical protein